MSAPGLQTFTQGKISSSQISHFSAKRFFCCGLTAANGQDITQDQQATHCSESTVTLPVEESCLIAPEMHASTQGASKQWQQKNG
jgi:hypothetical protein